MGTETLTLSSIILSGSITLLSVVIGSLVTYFTTSSVEKKRFQKEDRQKEFERRLEMSQILEFFENKCECFIMDYQGMGGHLEFENFPTFHLMEIEKLSRIRFFLKDSYKDEYIMFLQIENNLKMRKKNLEYLIFQNENVFEKDESALLSSQIYQQLRTIIDKIKNIKEKI